MIHDKSFRRLVLFVGILLSLSPAPLANAGPPPDDRQFLAGAATSNITPFLGAGIVGGWDAPPAEHVHDELKARCLVLDDGTTRLAFVIVDNVSVDRGVFDEAKRLANEATGLPLEHMLMAATHTHSGPSARGRSAFDLDDALDEYQRFLARRIGDAVRRAINQLEPARIGWGAASAPEHVFNRRWKMKDGPQLDNPFGGRDRVRMNPSRGHPDLIEPAGPTDPEIRFISVEAATGRPLALLANYSLHYVGGVPRGHISADYFGAFADRVQELLGADRLAPAFVGILSNGTSGDVNNINFLGPSERMPPYRKMRIVANDVAEKVVQAMQSLEYHSWVSLEAAQTELELRTRRPTPAQTAWAKGVLGRPDGSPLSHPREEVYARRALEMADWPETIQAPLQTFRIGELGVAAVPFETFAETGLEIKTRSPFPAAFTIELANGAYGYLPTPEQHELGGYETWLGTNRVEKEASEKIVAALMELFEQIKPEEKRH